jgi:hypothetical protein
MSNAVENLVWSRNDCDGRSAAKATLRKRALTQCFAMIVIASALLFFHRLTFASVIYSLSGVVLLIGLFAPKHFIHIDRFGKFLAKIIGLILTWGLLTPLWILVFIPAGLVLKIQGRDPLHRKLEDKKFSYWICRRSQPEAENYHRQFLVEDKEARAEKREVQ